MRNTLWTFLKRHLVGEVPDEMASCLECNAVQCTDDQYLTCPNRLARLAALNAIQPSDSHRPTETEGKAQT